MMLTKQFTFIILALFIGFAGIIGLSSASASAAYDPFAVACEEETAAGSAICKEKAATSGENPLSGDNSVLVKITDILALATAAIAVIVIIVAGFTMALSGGDSAKVKEARNTVIYAVVGVLVVALSRQIILFVVNKA